MPDLLSNEIRSWIGRSAPPIRLEVSRRDIIKYSIATEQTKKIHLEGDIAPPMFLFGTDKPLVSISDLAKDGLAKDVLDKLGEPYISKNKKGMGLGIFIAKNLIENMKGSIFFYNSKNNCAVVEIKFEKTILV